MNSVEALVELIVEAKSLNRNDSRLSFLRNEIEKDLEILEIIKRKKVAVFVIPLCKNAYDYSMKTSGFERLTDIEFRLIKEWLEK